MRTLSRRGGLAGVSRGSDLGTSYFGQSRPWQHLFQISQLLADFRVGR